MAEKQSVILTPRSLPEEWASLQHLAQHNAVTPYSSGPESSTQDYSSVQVTPYGSPSVGPYGSDHDSQLQETSSQNDWQPSVEQYYPSQLSAAHNAPRSTPGRTPYIQTRSRSSARLTPSSRQTTSSPPPTKTARRARQAKNAKSTSFILDEPLSKSTEGSTVPVKDMHAFVHRSMQKRMEEKEKKNGYIVRPMNAFMLYRSAYAERAKIFCSQNNHQVVSRATGQSWRLELKEVKDYYKQLSDIERENHQKAWPHYKFAPTKAVPALRKRKGADSGSENEGSDQDNSDHDWTPAGLRKPKSARHHTKRAGDHLQPLELIGGAHPYETPVEGRPYFQFPNHGCPNPVPMQVMEDLYAGPRYYTHQVHDQYQGQHYADDIHFQQGSYPVQHMEEARHGVPGVPSDELLEFEFPSELDQTQFLLDPALAFEPYPSRGNFTEQGFNDFNGDILGQHVEPRDESFVDTVNHEHGLLDSPFDAAGHEKFEQWIQDTNGEALQI